MQKQRSKFWTEDRTAALVALHAARKTTIELAEHFAVSQNAITGKLRVLNLSVWKPKPRPVYAPVVFTGRFEDHERADSDRHLGPKPKVRREDYSLVGNSSSMCARSA